MQWTELIEKHQQSHKPSFVNYSTFYLYANFCQRSDKWFLVKCDNSNSADLPEVTSAAGYCKATSLGPCISDDGQVVKCLDVSIGRLRKSGGQKIDLISLLLHKFS